MLAAAAAPAPFSGLLLSLLHAPRCSCLRSSAGSLLLHWYSIGRANVLTPAMKPCNESICQAPKPFLSLVGQPCLSRHPRMRETMSLLSRRCCLCRCRSCACFSVRVPWCLCLLSVLFLLSSCCIGPLQMLLSAFFVVDSSSRRAAARTVLRDAAARFTACCGVQRCVPRPLCASSASPGAASTVRYCAAASASFGIRPPPGSSACYRAPGYRCSSALWRDPL